MTDAQLQAYIKVRVQKKQQEALETHSVPKARKKRKASMISTNNSFGNVEVTDTNEVKLNITGEFGPGYRIRLATRIERINSPAPNGDARTHLSV